MRTIKTEGVLVYVSYEDAGQALVKILVEAGLEAQINHVSESGSTYGSVKYGPTKWSWRLSGHYVSSRNSGIHYGPKMVDIDLLKDTVWGFTPEFIEKMALEIVDDIRDNK